MGKTLRENRVLPVVHLEVLTNPAASQKSRHELVATIHEQIIPQLITTHHHVVTKEDPCADSRLPPTGAEVLTFAEIAKAPDLNGALSFIQDMSRGGLSLEVILLELVAPAARLLGDQWLADETSFSEVTIGLSTLQQVVSILGPRFAPGVADRGLVILASPLSEQHTLGIYLLGEFLRRAGWGVRVAPSLSESELVTMLSLEHVEMVGLSVSCTETIPRVEALVKKVRDVSMNTSLVVMLGGSHPALADCAARMGVTYCADAPDAVRRLEEQTMFNCGSVPGS